MTECVETAGARQWRLFLWLCAALRGERVDWLAGTADGEGLIALTGAHFITPTLAGALADGTSLPVAVHEYLDAVAFLNRERNDQILAAVSDAAACLASVNIPAVFLKGAAHLADGLYSDLAARFLGDVDVLVPRLAATAAARALADAGFSHTDQEQRRWVALRHHHLPMQRHVESGVGIEIHQELLYPAHRHIMSSEHTVQTAVPAISQPTILIPRASVRALHAIVHDQLGANLRRRRCGLRTLCDLSRLLGRPNVDAELAELIGQLPASAQHMANNVLALAGLLGAPADPEATRRACVWLRRGFERPGLALPDSVVDGIERLRFQPAAAINLLDPSRWSERIKRL